MWELFLLHVSTAVFARPVLAMWQLCLIPAPASSLLHTMWLYVSSLFACVSVQVSSCPHGTKAASLDIAKAYRNSPIIPCHKKYLCMFWKGAVYVQHVSIKGLAMAGRIQGNVADAALAILRH